MATVADINATTWEYRLKKPSDLISDNIPFFTKLKAKGRMTTIPGGRVIWEPAAIVQNQFVQRIDPTQQITMGFNDTLGTFEYTGKLMVVPITINSFEEAQNQGDAVLINLLKERQNIADDSLMNSVEEDLQGDGTAYAGKCFAGVKSYVVDDPTTGTYGGFSRVTYTSIRNISVNAPSTFTGATDSSNIESRIRYCNNQVERQGGVDFILAGTTYYNAGADAMSAKQRFTQDAELSKANFRNFMIDGATMVLANGRVFSGLSHIAVDRCYGLRAENFAMRMYSGYNFQPLPKRVSFNSLVEAALNLGIGQFTCNGSSLSFVMYDS